MRKIILFDLDGTLIESGEGIIKSLQYTFEQMNLEVPSAEDLRVFIGPPLLEQFMEYANFSQVEAEQAVDIYHSRYEPIGLFEATPYKGIGDMLAELKGLDYELAVSSSKPEELVIAALKHFNLSHYFSEIIGSSSELRTKGLVIRETLSRLSVNQLEDKVIMVGDKEHDVLGAREEDIECLSVLYGYGTRAELELVSPKKIVETVEELKNTLLTIY